MQPQPQPQQQNVVVTGVQPMYVAQPYQTATVVNSYPRGQSTVIGLLLIIAGCLSIIFNIVDLAIGTQRVTYRSSYTYYNTYSSSYSSYSSRYNGNTLSHESMGVSAHGFWCGVMVSF